MLHNTNYLITFLTIFDSDLYFAFINIHKDPHSFHEWSSLDERHLQVCFDAQITKSIRNENQLICINTYLIGLTSIIHVLSSICNAAKKARDINEFTPNTYNSRRNQYTSPMRGRMMFKQSGKSTESFTSLNSCREKIWREVLHMHYIPQLSTLRQTSQGLILIAGSSFIRLRNTKQRTTVGSKRRYST